ncbi:zinc finger, CCHC-type containing protein [Tanacetum coccineum]
MERPGSGDKWDQGYDFTARFLEYCDSLVPNFVAKLNKRIRKTFDVSFFKEGKPVEQLWKDYKAKYAGKN